MKRQFLVTVLIVILLAFLCANFVYEKYRKSILLEEDGNVYLLQQGVYTDTKQIKNIAASYITIEQDHKFYTYLGMTTKKENANKIKEIYEKRNIPVYIKTENIQNSEFLNALSQYDILLKNTDDQEEIQNILETIFVTKTSII